MVRGAHGWSDVRANDLTISVASLLSGALHAHETQNRMQGRHPCGGYGTRQEHKIGENRGSHKALTGAFAEWVMPR